MYPWFSDLFSWEFGQRTELDSCCEFASLPVEKDMEQWVPVRRIDGFLLCSASHFWERAGGEKGSCPSDSGIRAAVTIPFL